MRRFLFLASILCFLSLQPTLADGPPEGADPATWCQENEEACGEWCADNPEAEICEEPECD